MVRFLVVFIFLSFYQYSYACSYAIPIARFEITKEKTSTPKKPNFKLLSITRGSRIVGNTSCRGLAAIGRIRFELQTIPKNKQGYVFDIIEGNIGDNSLFSNGQPITLNNYAETKKHYDFMWFDYPKYYSDPINVKIKITTIALSGKKSSSQYVVIPAIEKGKRVIENEKILNLQKKLKTIGLYSGEIDGKRNKALKSAHSFILESYMVE